MPEYHSKFQGLSPNQVLQSRTQGGRNAMDYRKEHGFIRSLKSLAKEPMVFLLLATSTIYFISGQTSDGIFLAAAILLVAAISLYQDHRSRSALDKLKKITQPLCKVIRGGATVSIPTEDLVIGDVMLVEEGSTIAADGVLIQANDLSVNEAILTGEALPVFKNVADGKTVVFQGTTVASGLGIATVSAVGNGTELAKIGKSLESIKEEKTPLERQIKAFVRKMVVAGAIVFVIVWIINYTKSGDALASLLRALTLAMSILPEEIPVAFTTFMALGAWRLMRLGIVVKQMKTIETLGSATVICTDKTGTITENKMSLSKLYLPDNDRIVDLDTDIPTPEAKALIRLSMWASEPVPFDPMEIALHEAYAAAEADERPRFRMAHEYPLSGKPPMMTHIFENEVGERIIAAKGAPEALMDVSDLSLHQRDRVAAAIQSLSAQGYRVLGVGEADFGGNDFPSRQQDFPFRFRGLVAFNDPPKKNIRTVFQQFYAAGIDVKIITGDNAATTEAIARQVGLSGYQKSISGDELMKLPDDILKERAAGLQVFSRMFPEAKLRIINALKADQQIVAMTGDGVNDGPALKAAHIGIAMGKRGTEIARDASAMILLHDDLSQMVEAVAMGRRIYENLKKAVRYIISIHIPIILTVFLPLALGWVYPNIFTPVHIIFMELIMGPTCSVIYENEPMEQDTMSRKPRPFTTAFFSWKELTISIVQGMAITVAALFVYQYAVHHSFDEPTTRAMVFTVLISANIVLTLVNRSFHYSILQTIRNRNILVPVIISATILCTALLLYLEPLTRFFQFTSLNGSQLLLCVATGFISVIWLELVKWRRRLTSAHQPRAGLAYIRQ